MGQGGASALHPNQYMRLGTVPSSGDWWGTGIRVSSWRVTRLVLRCVCVRRPDLSSGLSFFPRRDSSPFVASAVTFSPALRAPHLHSEWGEGRGEQVTSDFSADFHNILTVRSFRWLLLFKALLLTCWQGRPGTGSPFQTGQRNGTKFEFGPAKDPRDRFEVGWVGRMVRRRGFGTGQVPLRNRGDRFGVGWSRAINRLLRP